MNLSSKTKLFDNFSTGIIVFNPKKPNDFIEELNLSALAALGIDRELSSADLDKSHPNLSKLFKELLGGSVELNYKNKKRIELRANAKSFNVFITLLEDGKYLLEFCEIISRDIGKTTHELKRPIQNIKSLAESLIMGAKDDQAMLNKFLKNINEETDRLGDLVNNILQLSSLESDSVELSLQPVDLAQLIKEIVLNLAAEASKKDIKIQVKEDSSCEVKADKNLLKHLLENLIENAIKYNKEDGEVFVEIDKNNFTVRDTGVGIPEADQLSVFEQFYRASNSSISQGSGLGLAIVKKITDLHSWKIKIKSQENQGTEFTIEF